MLVGWSGAFLVLWRGKRGKPPPPPPKLPVLCCAVLYSTVHTQRGRKKDERTKRAFGSMYVRIHKRKQEAVCLSVFMRPPQSICITYNLILFITLIYHTTGQFRTSNGIPSLGTKSNLKFSSRIPSGRPVPANSLD